MPLSTPQLPRVSTLSTGSTGETRLGWRQPAARQCRKSVAEDSCSLEQAELLTVVELAACLKCSPSFLYRRTLKHAPDPIPVATWLGNRPRFRLAEVEAWLQARKPSQNCVNLADGSVAARDRRIKQMSRRCHQNGHVRLRKDVKRPYWQGLYRVRSEDQPEGKWKSENLGYKDEITKRQAQSRFQKIISKMESDAYSDEGDW